MTGAAGSILRNVRGVLVESTVEYLDCDQGRPAALERDGAEPWYYREETRRALWGALGMATVSATTWTLICHETYPLGDTGHAYSLSRRKLHECPGAAALHQRALICWTETGEIAMLRRGSTRTIAARMLGIVLYKLRDWKIDGRRQVNKEDLIRAAHPALLDPGIASDEVAPSTDDELARWAAIRHESEA